MSATACPHCHAPSTTVPDMGVAECTSCGLVFELSGVEFEPFDEANPPPGVEVRRDGETLVLTLPWSAEVTLAGHVLQFSFPLALATFIVVGASVDPSVPVPAILGVMLVAGSMLYAAVCYVVNATTVRIGPQGATVVHGPLPTHVSAVSVPAGRVQGLRTRTVMVRAGRGGEVERYGLEGRDGMVLTKWVYEEPVRYVLGAIRATLLPGVAEQVVESSRARVPGRERA